jgi:spermidine/putrescine transport system substrate-binding protein
MRTELNTRPPFPWEETMKRKHVLFILGLVATTGLIELEYVRAQTKVLNVFNWSEYIDPQILKDFEKREGVKVNYTLYESNEDLLAKLETGGTKQYDVIMPGQYIIPVMVRKQLLLPLNKAKIPNLKNLSNKFVNPSYDPNNTYSAAYQWGSVGMVYDRRKVKDSEVSWGLMFDKAKQKGSFLMMDSTREMLGPALKYLGYSVNTTKPDELKRVVDLVIDAKGRSLGFDNGVAGRNKVAGGQAAYAMAYNGDVIKLQAENKNLGYAVPREGSVIFVDSMAIPAGAPNAELAHKFINYILDPRVGARLSNYNRYATPNEAAKPFISPADRTNPGMYPPADIMAKLEFITDAGDAQKLYDAAWTKIKAR